MPCTNCSRGGITCVYPTKDTDSARKGPTLQKISEQLERLEILLSRFAESSQITRGSTANCPGGESQTQVQIQSGANAKKYRMSKPNPSGSTWELLLDDERLFRHTTNLNIEPHNNEMLNMTKYIGSESSSSHLQKSTKAHHEIPAQLDAKEMVSDLLKFYPDTQLALQLWNVYVKSVDPVLKILHIPTVQTTVVATVLDPRSAQHSTVALTFAIYFAAITALCYDNDHEPIDLPCEKEMLLKRYKTCLDHLLTVNDLIELSEMTALQALAIYVTCLRVHEIGRRVWILNGLAIRLAKLIGLHIDGACLQLSPFETEMRLRLWWHLCVLESRAPEDQGLQPTVDVMNPKLRLPLNVNDNQICPDMTCLPVESDGWTDMSFFLIQTESCRLLHPILNPQGQSSEDALLDIAEKRKIIRERSQYLSAKYSGACTHLSRIAIKHRTAARKKMEFVLQLREEINMRQQKGAQEDTFPDVLKPSFKLACDGLESNNMLLKGGVAFGFKWFFNMYTPWYALAYVLRCLCSSPSGFETERAWALVDDYRPRVMSLHGHGAGIHDKYGQGSIWRCLNLLLHQALSLRQYAQLNVGNADVEIQPPSSGDQCIPQLLSDTEIPPPNSAKATAQATSKLPELDPDFNAEPNQIIFSSMDLSMHNITFLSDWNAVFNGSLNDDGYEINPSCFTNHHTNSAQF